MVQSANYIQTRKRVNSQTISASPPGLTVNRHEDHLSQHALSDSLTIASVGVSLSRVQASAASSGQSSKGPKSYKRQKMAWPLTAGWKKITGTYGEDRGSRAHGGLDMAVPTGTPVKAALDGKIISSTPDPDGYGTHVVLRHNRAKQPLQTLYAHLSKKLASRARVRKGEPIGLSGNTGRSTGPHLHFEVQRGGQKLDPQGQIGSIHNVHKWFR